MTSKEALEKMAFYVSEELSKEDFIKCYETILKDLEVLEILKECTEVKEKYVFPYLESYFELNHYINWTKCTKNEYEKVNDWLEREDENDNE